MVQLLAQVHHVRRAHLDLALPPPDARVRRSAGDVAVADGAELPPEIVAGFVPATPNESALFYRQLARSTVDHRYREARAYVRCEVLCHLGARLDPAGALVGAVSEADEWPLHAPVAAGVLLVAVELRQRVRAVVPAAKIEF